MSYIETGYENEKNIQYMQVLEDRLKKNPQDIQALIEKGFLYIDPFLRVEEGIEILKLAVKLAPDNVEAYYWLATGLYHGLCNNEEAIKTLKKALDIDPTRADCLNLLSDLTENPEKLLLF